jgi:hypothetical protein
MNRRLAPALLALAILALTVMAGCAGPSKLAQRSEEKLASDPWKAWQLATRALDKEPGNVRARAAAKSAAGMISANWQEKIHAMADVDSVQAAEEVLNFDAFRAQAVRYAAVPVNPEFQRDEQILRHTAARLDYVHAVAALDERRPKKAYLLFADCERFVPEYRDAARLAERAYSKALTRVAVMPLNMSSGDPDLGRDVADEWRDRLAQQLAPPSIAFTRVLGADAVEQAMTVSQLGRMNRDDAIRVGRAAGAERVVWGTIGRISSDTGYQLYSDAIAHKIVDKDADGHETTRWVDVPFAVVARTRTVTADLEYEVVATKSGASIAHDNSRRQTVAHALWTLYLPVGDLDSYALVSDAVRAADPDRANRIQSHWNAVCGEGTTLRAVLEARRGTQGSRRYSHDARPRLIAGAPFLFLEDLPPTGDLAYAALAGGWHPVLDDLAKLDQVDDVDLGAAVVDSGDR